MSFDFSKVTHTEVCAEKKPVARQKAFCRGTVQTLLIMRRNIANTPHLHVRHFFVSSLLSPVENYREATLPRQNVEQKAAISQT
jgi:hypothetical protein